MAYFVYIVECADKTYYCGSTNNLEKRIHAHNTAKTGARYTKIRRPVVLKYAEEVVDVSEALKREAAIKRMTRKEKALLWNDQ